MAGVAGVVGVANVVGVVVLGILWHRHNLVVRARAIEQQQLL